MVPRRAGFWGLRLSTVVVIMRGPTTAARRGAHHRSQNHRLTRDIGDNGGPPPDCHATFYDDASEATPER
jgi:hypothetical protein